ncbi:MAG TPA: FxLYD domain-containing protein [Vicinamibacterales bacterium]|jgi:hypothetical protein|nr:FxLYD domain-containing protein [Vicinamibacterales bacterium]
MRARLLPAVAGMMVLLWAAMPAAETSSKKITWVNEQWIPVNLTSEGITIKEVRFEVEGGVHWNPLRAGVGPQCFVRVKNESDHEMKLAVALALYDANGDLIAATESGHIGSLDPNESDEIKMTFREVKRKFFEAKTGQIALETYK